MTQLSSIQLCSARLNSFISKERREMDIVHENTSKAHTRTHKIILPPSMFSSFFSKFSIWLHITFHVACCTYTIASVTQIYTQHDFMYAARRQNVLETTLKSNFHRAYTNCWRYTQLPWIFYFIRLFSVYTHTHQVLPQPPFSLGSSGITFFFCAYTHCLFLFFFFLWYVYTF